MHHLPEPGCLLVPSVSCHTWQRTLALRCLLRMLSDPTHQITHFNTTPCFCVFQRRKRAEILNTCYLYKPSELCIGGIVRDEESQTVIGDLHWSRPVHFYTQRSLLIKKKSLESTVLQRVE